MLPVIADDSKINLGDRLGLANANVRLNYDAPIKTVSN